jgi:D-xylose transport system substrate-binding protein
MKWIFIFIAIVLVMGSIVIFSFLIDTSSPLSESPSEDQMVIGLSLGTLRSERWVQDRDLFVARAEELGAKVIVLAADEDPEKQVMQAENLILQGVDVLVVVAEDGERASVIVDKAHEADIQVIAYDRLIQNPDLDYYVSFDNVKVGEHQAREIVNVVPKGKFAYVGGSPSDNNAYLVKEGSMSILQPLIDKGDITLVFDKFHDDWKQEVAYANMKEFLAGGNTVDAVVAANDSTAAGVILALEEVGLAGKVPVSGQDAALGAVQNIVAGKQTVSIYKPLKDLAHKAAEMAVDVIKGESVLTNYQIDNNDAKTPSYLLDVVPVTIENVDETVIKDGFHTREEVYGETTPR